VVSFALMEVAGVLLVLEYSEDYFAKDGSKEKGESDGEEGQEDGSTVGERRASRWHVGMLA
jgi:hypothetical protein